MERTPIYQRPITLVTSRLKVTWIESQSDFTRANAIPKVVLI